MIPPHVRDYLRALSDDASARVLGWAWDASDAKDALRSEVDRRAARIEREDLALADRRVAR
jgi:hypothetical protein